MAIYYWVGGAGTWNASTTTNWSLTSGGAGGAGVPTLSDDVVFNASSNATAYTCTVVTGAVCSNMTVVGPTTGRISLSGSNSDLNVYGSLSFSGGAANGGVSPPIGIKFNMYGTGSKTITTNSVVVPNMLLQSAGYWSLGSALGVTAEFTFNSGTLDLNTYNLSSSTFVSDSTSTRSIVFGTGSSIKCVASGSVVVNINGSGFSYTGTSQIIIDNTPQTAGIRTITLPNFTQSTALSFKVVGSDQLTFGAFTVTQIGSFDFVNFTGVLTPAAAGLSISGNLTLSASINFFQFLSSDIVTFNASTSQTQTITTNGKTIPFAIVVNAPGAIIATVGTFTSTSSWTISDSTSQFLPGDTFTVSTFSSSSTGSQSFLVNYIITGSGSAYTQTVARNAASYVVGGTTYISMTSASAKTFTASNSLFSGLRQGGDGTLTISGTGNFFQGSGISNSNPPVASHTIAIQGGSTINVSRLNLAGTNGTSSNRVILTSTNTSRFNINKLISGGTNISVGCLVSYMSGNNVAVGGGGVFWQFNDSSNGGNNTGIAIATTTYYWVGGSGTWDATTRTNWSISSGGAGGYGPPSQYDGVVFDTASSANNYTVTISGSPSVAIASIAAPASGKITLAGTGSLSLASLNITASASEITNSFSGNITFLHSENGGLINSNSIALASNINFNNITTSRFNNLLSPLVTTGNITLTGGALWLLNGAITANSFDSNNSNARQLLMAGKSITLTGSGTVWNTTNQTGFLTLSYNATVYITNSGSVATTVATGNLGEQTMTFRFTAGTYTLTFLNTAGDACQSVDFTGFNGTLAATNDATIYGNVTLSSGMTIAATSSTLTLANTTASTTNTFTSNGTSLSSYLNINYAPTSTLQLNDAMRTIISRDTTHTSGILNLNNFNLTTGIYNSSNTNTRSIAFGTGNIILGCPTPNQTVVNLAVATGFSTTGTGGFASAMAVDSTFNIGSSAGSVASTANLFLTGGSAIATLTTGSYFKTIDFTGYSGTPPTTTLYLAGYVLSTGGTFTNITARMISNGAISSNGKSIATIDFGYGFPSGIPGTYATSTISTALRGTVGTAATTSSPGVGPVSTYTGGGDDGYWGITPGWNIQFYGVNYTTIYPGSNGYITFGGGSTAYSPLSATNPAFPKIMLQAADRSAQTLYYQTTGTSPNRTFWWRFEGSVGTSGIVGSPTVVYEAYLYENDPSTIDIVTGAMGTGGLTGIYTASTLLNAAATLGTSNTGTRITFTPDSGFTYTNSTTTITDNLNVTGAVTLSSGTLTSTSGNVTTSTFSATSTTAKTLAMGSGTWTITGSGATAWNIINPTFITILPGTSTISMSSALAKTFAGADKTWGTLLQSGIGALTITGSNTFNDITANISGRPSTIFFTAGTTTTLNNFSLSGSAGNSITITSDTGAGTYTLSKSSGKVVSNYLNILYAVATGGATWTAPTNLGNIDLGNNTGWIFISATGNFFLFF